MQGKYPQKAELGLLMTLPPQKLYPHGFEGAPQRFFVGGFGDGFGVGLGDGLGEALGDACGDGLDTRTCGLAGFDTAAEDAVAGSEL